MLVTAHAEQRIRSRVGAAAPAPIVDRIIDALERVNIAGDVAVCVYTFHGPVSDGTGSNGDQLVVIARDGTVETVMLRRSWNQPFTAQALGVERVVRL